MTLLKYLDRSSFDPVVVFPYEGPLIDEIMDLKITTHISPLEWWIRVPQGFGTESTNISFRLDRISEIIGKERPDLIHTNTSVVWEGALCAKNYGIPHVWHIHEILSEHPTLRSILPLPLVYWAINMLSDRVVVVSNAVRDKLPTFINKEKIITIYNGIDTEAFRPCEESSVREEFSVPEKTVLGVSIGSLVKEKNYNDLIEAITLVKKVGGNGKFLIVGDGSPEAVQLLKTQIKSRGLADCVFYLGYRKDIPRILLGSDFLILSSISEAFPMVSLEAMVAGKPVVATNCGGVSEMISEGESGFLVPVSDPGALSKKILYMLTNRDRMKSMGKKALEEVSRRYSAKKYAAQFEELYKTTLIDSKNKRNSGNEGTFIDALIEMYEDQSRKYREIFEMEYGIKRMSSSWFRRITARLRWIRQLTNSCRN